MKLPTPDLKQVLSQLRERVRWPHVLAVLLLVCLVVLGGRELAAHLKQVETWIKGLGPWAGVGFVLLFAVASSVLVPDTLLCMIAGAAFSFGHALLAVAAGVLLGVVLQYLLGRRLLQAWVERMLEKKPSWAAIRRAVLRDELRLQILLRLAPLNAATVSYVLSAAGVRFSRFFPACLCLSPHLLLEVYYGYAAKHAVMHLNHKGLVVGLHEVLLGVGVVAGIVVMVMIAKMARRALEEAVEMANDCPAEDE